MRRVREGSEDAAWELVRRYGGYVRRAVRRTLNDKLRPSFDSLDFVQLVWQSFFRLRSEADRFERPERLVAFLAAVACNKVRMEARRLATQKRDIDREVSRCSCRSGGEAAPGPEPVDVAIARERWNQILRHQPTHYRRIIQLKLQGHTCADVATILDLDAQTVRRFLKRLLLATAP